MRNWIRRILDLDFHILALEQIQRRLDHQANMLARVTATNDALLPLLNRLVALMFDEHSPERKNMSDEIGRAAIARAKAEDKARKHTLGEL